MRDRPETLSGMFAICGGMLARACGHTDFGEFRIDDLTTWKREMADLSGVRYAGVGQA